MEKRIEAKDLNAVLELLQWMEARVRQMMEHSSAEQLAWEDLEQNISPVKVPPTFH